VHLTTGDRDGERWVEGEAEGGIERSHASQRERKTEVDKKQAVHEGRLWMHHLCRISRYGRYQYTKHEGTYIIYASVCALMLRILISASHTQRTDIFGYASTFASHSCSESSSSLLFFFSFLSSAPNDFCSPPDGYVNAPAP
jgi:hypothetical protein